MSPEADSVIVAVKRGVCADCSFWRYCEGNGMHLREAEGKLMDCNLKKN